MRTWVLAAAILTAAISVTAGPTPWQQAFAGAFLPPDFAQDVAAAQVVSSGRNPYQVGIADEHARLMGGPADIGYPFFPHPPLALGLTFPFASLPFRAAAHVWFAVSLMLLWALASVLAGLLAEGRHLHPTAASPRRLTLVAFAALLAWPPVLYNLEKGQWSILVALLLALSWRFGVSRRPREAGLCVGLAAALKVFPALLIGYLALRAPRAAMWAVVTGVATCIVPFFAIGGDTIGAFITQSRGNVAYWETWPAVTYAIHGVVARTLVGGTWAQPFLHAPVLARAVELLASVGLVAAAFLLTRRGRSEEREGARYVTWAALLVALNPLSMGHNGVMLALPIVLVGIALRADARAWPKVAWVMGVALASVPRQALVPTPPMSTGPWEGLLLISLPLWGTLLLFVAASAVSADAPREAASFAASRAT